MFSRIKPDSTSNHALHLYGYCNVPFVPKTLPETFVYSARCWPAKRLGVEIVITQMCAMSFSWKRIVYQQQVDFNCIAWDSMVWLLYSRIYVYAWYVKISLIQSSLSNNNNCCLPYLTNPHIAHQSESLFTNLQKCRCYLSNCSYLLPVETFRIQRSFTYVM